jgi:hypothetical protein
MMRYDSGDLKTYSIDSPSFHPRKLPLIETMQPLDDLVYDPKSSLARSTDSSKTSKLFSLNRMGSKTMLM